MRAAVRHRSSEQRNSTATCDHLAGGICVNSLREEQLGVFRIRQLHRPGEQLHSGDHDIGCGRHGLIVPLDLTRKIDGARGIGLRNGGGVRRLKINSKSFGFGNCTIVLGIDIHALGQQRFDFSFVSSFYHLI